MRSAPRRSHPAQAAAPALVLGGALLLVGLGLWAVLGALDASQPGATALAGPDTPPPAAAPPVADVPAAAVERGSAWDAPRAAEPAGDQEEDAPAPAERPPEAGWLQGRVTRPDGSPILGAVVTARWAVRRPGRASASTGPDGRYRIELAALTAEHERERAEARRRARRLGREARTDADRVHALREALAELERYERDERVERYRERARTALDGLLHRPWEELVVTAEAAEHALASRRLLVEPALRPALRVDFVLAPGSTLHGRVVDAAGRGVPSATVNLVGLDLELVRSTWTDAAGGYRLGLGAAAGPVHLHARHERVGASGFLNLHLVPQEAALPDLVLEGAGALTGLVRDPDGDAVGGLELEALPAELAHLPHASVPFTRLVEAELDGGLFHARTSTDDRGQFALGGLQPGRWALRFTAPVEEAWQPSELFEVTQQNIELVFYGYLLHVRALDAESRPHPFATVSCTRLERGADGEDRLHGRRDRRPECGYATFLVEPGERYLLRAWAPETLEDAAVVPVVPGRYQVWTDLNLVDAASPLAARSRSRSRADEPSGRIEIAAETADGEPLEGFAVQLADAESGRLRSGFVAARPDAAGLVRSVPPGRYRLRLVPVEGSALAVEVEHPEPVVVRAGGTTRVAVTAPEPEPPPPSGPPSQPEAAEEEP